jgi:hypothetical protein
LKFSFEWIELHLIRLIAAIVIAQTIAVTIAIKISGKENGLTYVKDPSMPFEYFFIREITLKEKTQY